MNKYAVSKLSARVEELRQDWPLLIADDDVGYRFCDFLDDDELEQMLEDFIIPKPHTD